MFLWMAEAIGDASSSITTQIGDPAGSHITDGAADAAGWLLLTQMVIPLRR